MQIEDDTARYYIGLAVASTITKYSLRQLFVDVNETIKNDLPLSEVLTSSAFVQAVIKFIDGPREELHLAGLEMVNLFRWRDACKITTLTQREAPKLSAFHGQLIADRSQFKKLILDRSRLRTMFFDVYRPWVQITFPQKAGEILAVRL